MSSPRGLDALAVVLREGMPWQIRYLHRLVHALGEQNAALEEALAESEQRNLVLHGRLNALSRIYRRVDADYDSLRDSYEFLAEVTRDAWQGLRTGMVDPTLLSDLEDILGSEGPLLLPREDVNMDGILADESDEEFSSDNDSDDSGMYD